MNACTVEPIYIIANLKRENVYGFHFVYDFIAPAFLACIPCIISTIRQVIKLKCYFIVLTTVVLIIDSEYICRPLHLGGWRTTQVGG